jgi:hypothetical protein
LQEDSTSVSCAYRERAHQFRDSSKRSAPSLERDSLQEIGRAVEDSITWVFIAEPWTSDLVLSETVLWIRLFLEQWGELRRRRAFLRSRSSPFGGVTLHI